MKLQDYIDQALRSEQPLDAVYGKRAFVALAIDTLIAAGALADLLKKQLVYGKPITDDAYRTAIDLVTDTAESAKSAVGEGANTENLKLWPRLTHAALGGYGEWAELLDALLESSESGEVDRVNVIEEVGDVSWYTALALDELGEVGFASPAYTLGANIAKLKARFPDKFTLEASENRDVDAEAAAIRSAA